MSVMLQATRQQAEGCPDFRARLQETGTTLLAEASEYDGFWRIGMKAETAVRTPQSERRNVFGQNKAGMDRELSAKSRKWARILRLVITSKGKPVYPTFLAVKLAFKAPHGKEVLYFAR